MSRWHGRVGRVGRLGWSFSRRPIGGGLFAHGFAHAVYRPQVGVFLPGGWGVVVYLTHRR